MFRRGFALLSLLSAVGCSALDDDNPGPVDATGTDDVDTVDAATLDGAGDGADAALDARSDVVTDGSPSVDAKTDTRLPDGGNDVGFDTRDAATADTTLPDANLEDTSTEDTAPGDTGLEETGLADSALEDTGGDAGLEEAGLPDTALEETGSADAGLDAIDEDQGTDGASDAPACSKPSHCPAAAHATNSQCVAGACRIAKCQSSYQDCNGVFDDGCESNRLTDPSHCGQCATACATAQTCVKGVCTP